MSYSGRSGSDSPQSMGPGSSPRSHMYNSSPRSDMRTPNSQYLATPRSQLLATPSSSGTPYSRFSRSDLGSHNRPHFYRPRTPSSMDGPMSDADPLTNPSSQSTSEFAHPRDLVWGTQVDVNVTMAQFERFLAEYRDPISGELLYPRVLEQICMSDVNFMNLDCLNLMSAAPTLYTNLLFFPNEVIPVLDHVITRYKQEHFPDRSENVPTLLVRPFRLASTKSLRELNPHDVDCLVAIKGMVIRCGNLIPELKAAYFQCVVCNADQEVPVVMGEIVEPVSCMHCASKRTMQLIHNRGLYSDKQLIRIQETPDEIPDGETPHTVSVFAFDDLVDQVKPGDRVEITGIFRAQPLRSNARQRSIMNVFRTHVDVVHFRKLDNRKWYEYGEAQDEQARQAAELTYGLAVANNEDVNGNSTTQTDVISDVVLRKEEELRTIARDPNVYERLVRSLAPSIWEMDDVKKGVLAMLFGGTNTGGASSGASRGEIHVLLCGDPGTSKSQLLQYVHKLSPRGIYTSGKGSSAVGLTAYITRDPVTNDTVLESGALVLSDRGVCCIDEFDKMSDMTRSILHEVMEQQTVSVAKAGIVCTLNARTSILASANPIQSRYNPKLSVVQNIDLGPALLSRFDLIYLILDQPVVAHDFKLAHHLINMYRPDSERSRAETSDIIPTETLAHYISYARRHIKPQLTDEAEDALLDAYIALRSEGQRSKEKTITATPRQLESLIRISEALAKMHFRDHVTVEDAREAARLMHVATRTAATNPETGLIDMDLITTGYSTEDRNRTDVMRAGVREYIQELPLHSTVSLDTILADFNQSLGEGVRHATHDQMRVIMSGLVAESLVEQIGSGLYKVNSP